MPNYVKNRIEILGTKDQVKEVIEKFKAFDHFPDFEKVIPPPENIFRGDLGKAEEEICKREGRPTWYDWNRANWGTKWNCCACEKMNDNIFIFETAWGGVPIIVNTISKQFPDIEFIYEFADEDTGYNTGIYKLKNGINDEIIPAGGSNKAYEIALKLRPENKEYYKLVDGEYEYVG